MFWITLYSCSGHCCVVLRHLALSQVMRTVCVVISPNNKRACKQKRPGCAVRNIVVSDFLASR